MIDEPNKVRALTGQLMSHFDLSGDPFSIENECFFEDAQRKHNIETLRHLAIFGDMVLLLTGEIGAGKSSLIEQFVQTQAEELDILVYRNPAQFIKNSMGAEKLDKVGSIHHFADLIGLNKVDGERSDQTLFRLVQQCNLKFQESGKRTLLIVDDADLLSKEELMLYFSVFSSLPVESGVVLLLSGTPKLLRLAPKTQEGKKTEQLHQIQLKPLSNSETLEYIQCRLASVGYLEQLSLSENQRENLAKMGKGLPGRINRFFASIVFDLGLPEVERPTENNVARKVVFSIAGLLLLSFVLVSYQHGLLDFSITKSGVVVGNEETEGDEAVKTEEELLIELQREARLKMLGLAIQESAPEDNAPKVHEKVHEKVNDDVSTVSSGDNKASKPNVGLIADTEVAKEPLKSAGKSSETHKNLVEVERVGSKVDKEVSARSTSTVLKEVKKASVIAPADRLVGNNDLEPKAVVKPYGFKEKSWVESQSPSHYSAQLLGSYNEETAIQFIEKAGKITPALFYLKTLYKGREWYVVFYGSFASKKEAQSAVSASPKVVQKQGPWLRRFDGILNSYPK